MKSIRTLLLLLPALIIVSCQKSDIKPRSCAEHGVNTPVKEDNKSESTENTSGFRSSIVSEDEEDTGATEVVGTGDDDRDGGDKKKKSAYK